MPASPDQIAYYRALRLRSSLTQAHIQLEEAVAEITIADTFAANVLAAELDVKRAKESVVALVKVLKDEQNREVK